MKILVLGATGGTGMQIIKRAILSGHQVAAFARNPAALGKFGKVGDPLDRDQLKEALLGQDTVLSGLGPCVPVAKSDEHLMRGFGTSLVSAMEAVAVSRLVIVSSAFLFKDALVPPTYLIGRMFFNAVVKDLIDLERIVVRSNTEWTIVRPPQLTDREYTGQYRERVGHLPFVGFKYLGPR